MKNPVATNARASVRSCVNCIRLNLFPILLFLLLPCLAQAQEPEVLFKQGVAAYQQQDYAAAKANWKAVLEQGQTAPELLYSLGNTAYQLQQWPEAVLWYERALKAGFAEEELLQNLELARLQLADQVQAAPELEVVRWSRGIIRSQTSRQWGYWALASLWFAAGLLLFAWLLQRRFRTRPLVIAAGVFVALSLFTLFLGWQEYQIETTDQWALIWKPAVTVKSAPDEAAPNAFQVHQGLKVATTDQVQEWVQVVLPDGKTGWVQQAVLKRI